MTRTITSALALATIVAAPMTAQGTNPVVGKWDIEYERGRRVENDVPTPIMGKGTLTIVQQGDSLVATLEPGPRPDGSASPPSTAGGRMTAAGAVFAMKRSATMNTNGQMSIQELTLTWTLQASGDTITGTMKMEMPHEDEPAAASPVKGTRAAK